MLTVLRNADHRRMPWKNGGGVTTEIAIFPHDAAIADFDWRVSMAVVAEDGPFSLFAGIDRTLSILDGEGMELVIDGQPPAMLTQATEPLAFPADAATTARLVAGPITDLNVMTRRGQFSHTFSRSGLFGETAFVSGGETTLLLTQGPLHILGAGVSELLEAGDAVLFSGPPSACRLLADSPQVIFRIDISPQQPIIL